MIQELQIYTFREDVSHVHCLRVELVVVADQLEHPQLAALELLPCLEEMWKQRG